MVPDLFTLSKGEWTWCIIHVIHSKTVTDKLQLLPISLFEFSEKKTSLNMISKLACFMKIVLRTIALNISQVSDWAWFLRHWHEINDPESLNPFSCYFLQRDFLAVWALHMKWNSMAFLFILTFLYDVLSMTKWLLGMFESDTLVKEVYWFTLS